MNIKIRAKLFVDDSDWDQPNIFPCCDSLVSLLPWSDIGAICPQDQETDWPEEGDEEKWFGVERILARDCFWMGLLERFKRCSTKYRMKRPVCCKREQADIFFFSLCTTWTSGLVRLVKRVLLVVTEKCWTEIRRIMSSNLRLQPVP